MDDLLQAILQPIGELFGLGDDDGDTLLPGGGPLWIILLTAVCLVGATLLWFWLE